MFKKACNVLVHPKVNQHQIKRSKAQYKKLPVLNSLAPSWGTIHPEHESSDEVQECAARHSQPPVQLQNTEMAAARKPQTHKLSAAEMPRCLQ